MHPESFHTAFRVHFFHSAPPRPIRQKPGKAISLVCHSGQSKKDAAVLLSSAKKRAFPERETINADAVYRNADAVCTNADGVYRNGGVVLSFEGRKSSFKKRFSGFDKKP